MDMGMDGELKNDTNTILNIAKISEIFSASACTSKVRSGPALFLYASREGKTISKEDKMNKAQKKIEEFILQQIENSTLPEWKCPWIARAKCNFITGHIYSGGNAALVAFNPNDFFMTFNQAKEIGYIKKGSHSLPIPFYKIIQDKEIKQTDHGIEIKEKTPRPILVSYYNVFGLNDIDIQAINLIRQ